MAKISTEAKKYLNMDGSINEQQLGFNDSELETTKTVLKSLLTKRFLQNLPQFDEIFNIIRSFGKRHKEIKNKVIRKRILEECQLKREKLREKKLIIDQLDKLEYEEQLMIKGAEQEVQIKNNQLEVEKIVNLKELKYDIKFGTCYCCGVTFKNVHYFYDKLCIQCGDFNYLKRNQKCDLTGRIALVTGGRIKIGYQTALLLLRNNCYTIVTTRFPKEAAFRFSKTSDFQKWKHLLKIYGVDFKCIPLVYQFCDFLKLKCPKLDIIINNAAQTIRRQPIYNSNFEEFERFNNFSDLDTDIQNLLDPEFQFQTFELQISKKIDSITANTNKQLPDIKQAQQSVQMSSTVYLVDQQIEQIPEIFDSNNQLVDFGKKNSWLMKLEEVSLQELLEVQIINSIAPFVICAQLKQLLEKSQFQERFIINVSAAEGQFNRLYKSSNHPHTNMAKASLNMMTRTSGSHYALSGIYMNAVDTGWVTDENPKNFNNQFTVPLDEQMEL